MNTPQIIRAQPITWNANSTAPCNLAFLDSSKGANPQVSALYATVQLTVDTGSSVGVGAQLHQMFSRIVLADGSGERINISGAGLRILNAAEAAFGGGYDDPDDVAANQTGTSVVFFLRLPIVPKSTGALREADFFPAVRELRDGGRLEFTFSSSTPGNANGWSIQSGTVTVYAEIQDCMPGLTSRLVLRENVMNQTDDVYVIGGALRWAIPYVGASQENAGPTGAWSVQLIDSFTLDYSQIPSLVFQERYKQAFPNQYVRADSLGAVTPNGSAPFFRSYNDPIANGYAIPFVQPEPFGKTTGLRFIDSVIHYRTSVGSFTGQPLFLTSTIQPRTPRSAQVATGAPGGLASAAVRDGKIAGTDTTAATVGPRAASVLPVTMRR